MRVLVWNNVMEVKEVGRKTNEHGESIICFSAGPMMDYILTPICDYKTQVCDNVLAKLLTNGYYDLDDFESIEWKVDFHCRH